MSTSGSSDISSALAASCERVERRRAPRQPSPDDFSQQLAGFYPYPAEPANPARPARSADETSTSRANALSPRAALSRRRPRD